MDRKSELSEKRERLALYRKAEKAILNGAQSYATGKFNLARANLKNVQDAIKVLEKEVQELEMLVSGRTARRKVQVVNRDW